MKNFFSIIALAVLTTNAFAIQSVVDYHNQNEEKIAAYKARNSLNNFAFIAGYECNHEQIAEWRTKQYDETFKNCLNAKYMKILKGLGEAPRAKAAADRLYSQNMDLEEELKVKAMQAVGLKLIKNQYGRFDLDLDSATAEKIEEAANLLIELLER